MVGSQDSSVSIATNDGIDNPGFDSRKGKDIFFSQKCPNRLGVTYTIIQQTVWVLSMAVQRSDVKLATLPHSSEVKIEWVYTTVLSL